MAFLSVSVTSSERIFGLDLHDIMVRTELVQQVLRVSSKSTNLWSGVYIVRKWTKHFLFQKPVYIDYNELDGLVTTNLFACFAGKSIPIVDFKVSRIASIA